MNSADILADNFLTQMAFQPTNENNILDLVLTNNMTWLWTLRSESSSSSSRNLLTHPKRPFQ